MSLVVFTIAGTKGQQVFINPNFVQAVQHSGRHTIIYMTSQHPNGAIFQYQVEEPLEFVAAALTS